MQYVSLFQAIRSLLLWIAFSILLVGCDVGVSNIEVTQAVQTSTNSIPLVAERSTTVRATLDVISGTAPIPNITGRLHVFVNGSEITPVSGIAAINEPFSAPAAPQRANENDTLNFELPAPTGIVASGDVDFRVDITVPGDTNTANDTLSANNLTAVNRTTPSLFFTRINYTPSGLGLPALADVQPGVGDAFVRGIFPVNDGDPNLYREGLFPTLNFNDDADGDGRLDALGSDGDNLLSFLASCRQLIVDGGLGANNNTFLYGWIAGNPIDGNGLGQVPGFNSFGNTEHIRHQRTYAHELGHNFGLSHNLRMLDEVGWDTGARLDGNPAGNNTTGRVKPTTLNDIMVGGQLTDSAWVDTTTYNFFSSSAILADAGPDHEFAGGVLASIVEQQEQEFPERVVVIQGIFDPAGEELISLQPTFRFPWPSQGTPREQRGRFAAEVIDEAGNATAIQFDALVGDDSGEESEGGEERTGFFEVMVPVAPQLEIVAVRITDAEGGREFGGFFERTAPPEIIVIEPQEGAELGEETEVAWDVRDPDTPDSELLYQVAYSPDDGQSWVPIAVNVPGTERGIVFNSTEIQKSEGHGMIRVFVSDGLSTAFADVPGLTTLAAQFPAP